MWFAIVVLIPVIMLSVVALISFSQGKITAEQVFHEVGKLSPIPKISDLNPSLLILGAGGILAGVAAIIAANKGNSYSAPSSTTFAVNTPYGGIGVGQAAPTYTPPARDTSRQDREAQRAVSDRAAAEQRATADRAAAAEQAAVAARQFQAEENRKAREQKAEEDRRTREHQAEEARKARQHQDAMRRPPGP